MYLHVLVKERTSERTSDLKNTHPGLEKNEKLHKHYFLCILFCHSSFHVVFRFLFFQQLGPQTLEISPTWCHPSPPFPTPPIQRMEASGLDPRPRRNKKKPPSLILITLPSNLRLQPFSLNISRHVVILLDLW